MLGMAAWAVAAVVVAAAGALVAGLAGPVLRRLPEPVDATPDKRPYRDLATRRFRGGVFVASATATAVVLWAHHRDVVPPTWLPLWMVWATACCLPVAIDAVTTWLPRVLGYACAGAAALALVPPLVLTAGGATPPGDMVRTIAAALATLGMYGAMWRLGAGLGFGDVRLAPVVMAPAASLSWGSWWVALVAASLVGVVWGLLSPRGAPFAYGPALWAGSGIALVMAL